MRFALTITGYSETNGKSLVKLEPHWWDAGELVKDNRFVETRKYRALSDYNADLSLEEARRLHEKYKGNVTTIQKWLCFRLKKLSPQCRQLHKALYDRSGKFSHFHISISEREPGL